MLRLALKCGARASSATTALAGSPCSRGCCWRVHGWCWLAVTRVALTSVAPPRPRRRELRPEHRVEAGRALLEQYQCGSCHVIPGVRAARGSFGPTLEAFGVRGYIAGQIPNTAPLLQRWLQQPSALVPGTLMPAMGVSADDAQAMAAYLLALR